MYLNSQRFTNTHNKAFHDALGGLASEDRRKVRRSIYEGIEPVPPIRKRMRWTGPLRGQFSPRVRRKG